MEAKLIKTKTGFYLWRNPLDKSQELLGATVPIMNDNGVDLREYKLSLKNCQAIELGYDLDELAIEYANKKRSIPTTEFRIEIFTLGFKDGFQKALEILGDKKFSEDDVKKVIFLCCNDADSTEETIFKSIQQTEWDVEIEMEEAQEIYRSGVTKYIKVPKLDPDGCLILKKIVVYL